MAIMHALEIHVTVRLSSPKTLGDLERWATARNLKCLHIVLARGAEPQQPMLSWRQVGSLEDAKHAARRIGNDLRNDDFNAVRVKIEASPDHPDAPTSSPGASERYFEHHVKLLLPPAADLSVLAETAAKHAAHLSRNALRIRDDGLEERFLTQRCFGVLRSEARRRLDDLLATLSRLELRVIDVEEEYVLYDDNLAVDAGWIS
jgi:hypothetical protein